MPVITEAIEGDEVVTYSREDVLNTTAQQIVIARRPLPVPEINRRTILTAARQALQANADYIASTPTNAQVAAQVKALSRQVNRLIRLVTDQVDSTD